MLAKIAADKDSKKLGKIVRVESLVGKTIKKLKPHLIIAFSRRFKKTIYVPIDAEQVIKAEGSYVWLGITKKDFLEEVKRLEKIHTEKGTYKGDLAVTKTRFHMGTFDPFNLGPKRKEKR